MEAALEAIPLAHRRPAVRHGSKLQANNLTNEGVKQGYLAPFAMNRYEMNQSKTFTLDLIYKF